MTREPVSEAMPGRAAAVADRRPADRRRPPGLRPPDAFGPALAATIDLGEVNDEFFVNNVSLGVYARIVACSGRTRRRAGSRPMVPTGRSAGRR
jgi:hypothetical protein